MKSLSPIANRHKDAFLAALKERYTDGTITPEKPITATQICKRWKAQGLTDVSIREMVNYWRQCGENIISTTAGYSWAPPGFIHQHSLDDKESRIESMLAAIYGTNKDYCAEILNRMNMKFGKRRNPKQELISFGKD